MLKQILEEISVERDKNNVFWDKSRVRWGIDSTLLKFGERYGGKLIAVFVTKENVRANRISERWCFTADFTERYPNPGSGFEVVRYVSHTTMSGGMAPIVAISPKQGKVKFLKDMNIEAEESEWGKPQKVQYMRYVK